MFRKGTKSNWYCIVICTVASISMFAITAIDFSKKQGVGAVLATLTVSIWYLSFLVIIYSIYEIIRKRNWNQYLKELPYKFNYNVEFEVYRRIGRKKKDRTVKELNKHGVDIPLKYSAWKKITKEKYVDLRNVDDFYRFLRRTKRNLDVYYDAITMVAVPLEIAIITAMVNIAKSTSEVMAVMIISACMIVILIVKEMKSAREEAHFIGDICEILFPENSLEK